MSKWLKRLGVIVCIGVVIAVTWTGAYPSGTWRYKMTVVVDTPEGAKTGSAVREVTVRSQPELTPETLPAVSVSGEAVVVDLGKRGVLFALLKGYKSGEDHSHRVVFDAFNYTTGGTTREGITYFSKLKDAKATLALSEYPMLVTFTDLNDPKTLRPVLEMAEEEGRGYPTKYKVTADHFEELFGVGVRLREISIEMTQESVTWGIERSLQWFVKEKIGLDFFDPQRPAFTNYLTNSDFRIKPQQ